MVVTASVTRPCVAVVVPAVVVAVAVVVTLYGATDTDREATTVNNKPPKLMTVATAVAVAVIENFAIFPKYERKGNSIAIELMVCKSNVFYKLRKKGLRSL